ncbi:MAG TPA: thiolase family protein [Acidimicrobiales bacterium]|nr:thiolase family protein [Acidimicrobiales bacterium]
MTPIVHVVGQARSPFGRFGGSLRTLSLPELGAHAAKAAMRRAEVDPTEVDEVVVGVNFPGSDRSVARQVQLAAGIPEDRRSYTVDRACCSSLAAINAASRSIRLGDARTAVAGGVENLSRVPYFLETARFGQRLGDVVLADQLVVSCPYSGVARAVQASTEAAAYGIGRDEQDAWACRSQERYAAALARRCFDDEVAPISMPDANGRTIELAVDEVPRPTTTLDALSELPTVYGSETVTAGNAPDLSTGSAMLVLSGEPLDERTSLAAIVGWAAAAGDPQHIASMPAVAGQLALKQAGITVEDVDVIEVNEAFAAVPLVTTLVLAAGSPDGAARLRERTNPNGGSIAIGHPTGATAARLVMAAVGELRRRGGGLGLVTICGGIGEAEAVVVRVDDMP